jgi:ankyrin repeat protein
MSTALHDAAKTGKADAVQLLLERRINKLIRDTVERTAREIAIKKKHDECAKLLE